VTPLCYTADGLADRERLEKMLSVTWAAGKMAAPQTSQMIIFEVDGGR